jgi:uncharacterized membrane protein
MSTPDIIYNGLGIIGASMLLFGFYRVNSGRWGNKSFWYELDNVIGASLIIIYQIRYHAFVTVVVNAIWAAVALWGLVVFWRRYHLHRHRRAKPRRA